MYLWRRQANPGWWLANEEVLRGCAGDQLVLIERADRKKLQLEAVYRSRREAAKLVREFGGHVQKLGRDWLQRFARERKSKPLRIGKRLIVTKSRELPALRCSVRCPQRMSGIGILPMNIGWKPMPLTNALRTANSKAGQHRSRARHQPSFLVIPAGAAFGTGDHVTTAMSLRLLEQLTREWKSGWSLVDLGTGSGVLALAGRRFGARRVLAIDNDPTAIATAKANARLNQIDKTVFRVGDVRRWKSPHRIDIVTANLFSELLIEILPRLKSSRWLIFSGVLRTQEKQFTRALRRNRIDIVQVRRRGKWIALLAKII